MAAKSCTATDTSVKENSEQTPSFLGSEVEGASRMPLGTSRSLQEEPREDQPEGQTSAGNDVVGNDVVGAVSDGAPDVDGAQSTVADGSSVVEDVEAPTGTRLESATKKGVRIGNMLSNLEDSDRDEEYKEKKNELHAHGRLALRADTAAGKALADAMEVVKQCEEKKKETAKALESAKVTIGAAQGAYKRGRAASDQLMQGYVDAAIQADNRIKKLKQQKEAAEEDAAKSKKKVADTINDIKHSFLGHIAMAEAEVRGS